jgi:hypothetical protein
MQFSLVGDGTVSRRAWRVSGQASAVELRRGRHGLMILCAPRRRTQAEPRRAMALATFRGGGWSNVQKAGRRPGILDGRWHRPGRRSNHQARLRGDSAVEEGCLAARMAITSTLAIGFREHLSEDRYWDPRPHAQCSGGSRVMVGVPLRVMALGRLESAGRRSSLRSGGR